MPIPSQIIKAEKDLMDSIDDLIKCKWIIGPPPTLDDLVDLIEECCGRVNGLQVVCNNDCCIEWFWVSMKQRIKGNKYLIRKHV